MKSSKAALQTSNEECGVWLDTVQLKQKNKKKLPVRPISKLLNPFTKGDGYSLAVALNFTQTKMEMPKTKQSSISSFFTPHRRVLNKMSPSEESNSDPEQNVSSSPPHASTAPSFEKKRDRDVHVVKHNVAPEWEDIDVTNSQTSQWQMSRRHTSSQNEFPETEEETSEEYKSPRRKKRMIDCLTFDSQPCPQNWSQDPLLSLSQFNDSQPDPIDQKYNTTSSSEPAFPDSLESEKSFVNLMSVEVRTSTQYSSKHPHSSQMDDGKENSMLMSCFSLSKAECKTASPQCDVNAQTERKTLNFSPLKNQALKCQSRDVHEESLAALFTQDTQGFRVIAHRGPQVRSPLRDQSNLITERVKTSNYVMEEEDDILFTQDSQGNVVIKH